MATEAVLSANQRLLDAISEGNWATYKELVDDSITCFEPESRGNLAHGLAFHQFYFDAPSKPTQEGQKAGPSYRTVNSMSAPQIRLLGDSAAVVAYTRLRQSLNAAGDAVTDTYEETRVWQLIGGAWKNVHFHKSAQSGNH